MMLINQNLNKGFYIIFYPDSHDNEICKMKIWYSSCVNICHGLTFYYSILVTNDDSRQNINVQRVQNFYRLARKPDEVFQRKSWLIHWMHKNQLYSL